MPHTLVPGPDCPPTSLVVFLDAVAMFATLIRDGHQLIRPE